MFGLIGELDTCEPIADFIASVEANPGAAGSGHRADRRSIDIAAHAGVVVLVETDYPGTDFVDYFSIARIDGRWWITNKTYGHAG
jgi:hypothetical protein